MGLKHFLSLLFFVSAAVCAQPLDMTQYQKTERVRQLSHIRFGPADLSDNLAESYCTTITQVFSLRSQHPGYGDRVNQRNRGYGFKCRIGTQDPNFVHMGGVDNSQWGSTFVVGFGKQVDMLSLKGPFNTEIRYYVGAELDALSYEWPSRRMTYYGIAPLWHQGLALHLSVSGKSSGFTGVIGMEQQHLPVDHIRMYQGYFRIIKRW